MHAQIQPEIILRPSRTLKTDCARRQFDAVSADELTGAQRSQLRESQDFRTAIFDLRQDQRRSDADIEERRTDSLASS